MANKIRDAEREAFWRGVIARQRSSGLGVRAFCRQEKHTESGFFAWRRTISQRDGEAQRRHGAIGPTAKLPAFVPAVVTGAPPREAVIVIRLAGGHVLRVPEAVSPTWLGEVVRVLDARGAQ
jgi:hypothetical protein